VGRCCRWFYRYGGAAAAKRATEGTQRAGGNHGVCLLLPMRIAACTAQMRIFSAFVTYLSALITCCAPRSLCGANAARLRKAIGRHQSISSRTLRHAPRIACAHVVVIAAPKHAALLFCTRTHAACSALRASPYLLILARISGCLASVFGGSARTPNCTAALCFV